jgi:hypothetical protein
MNLTMNKSVQAHRERLAAGGLKRLEICVRQADVNLIRRLARALTADNHASVQLRAAINQAVPQSNKLTFKEWLALGPEMEGN